jgi:hypothetical protein
VRRQAGPELASCIPLVDGTGYPRPLVGASCFAQNPANIGLLPAAHVFPVFPARSAQWRGHGRQVEEAQKAITWAPVHGRSKPDSWNRTRDVLGCAEERGHASDIIAEEGVARRVASFPMVAV